MKMKECEFPIITSDIPNRQCSLSWLIKSCTYPSRSSCSSSSSYLWDNVDSVLNR